MVPTRRLSPLSDSKLLLSLSLSLSVLGISRKSPCCDLPVHPCALGMLHTAVQPTTLLLSSSAKILLQLGFQNCPFLPYISDIPSWNLEIHLLISWLNIFTHFFNLFLWISSRLSLFCSISVHKIYHYSLLWLLPDVVFWMTLRSSCSLSYLLPAVLLTLDQHSYSDSLLMLISHPPTAPRYPELKAPCNSFPQMSVSVLHCFLAPWLVHSVNTDFSPRRVKGCYAQPGASPVR